MQVKCPGCDLELEEDDLRAQVQHMTTNHPTCPSSLPTVPSRNLRLSLCDDLERPDTRSQAPVYHGVSQFMHVADLAKRVTLLESLIRKLGEEVEVTPSGHIANEAMPVWTYSARAVGLDGTEGTGLTDEEYELFKDVTRMIPT